MLTSNRERMTIQVVDIEYFLAEQINDFQLMIVFLDF
jgi:hypothetical protein